jgi:hypothetical protein
MSDSNDRNEQLETPWEFLDDDGERAPSAQPAEEAAVHLIEPFVEWRDLPDDGDRDVVHYLDDEEPEIPDRSKRTRNRQPPRPCDELLIMQHYQAPSAL